MLKFEEGETNHFSDIALENSPIIFFYPTVNKGKFLPRPRAVFTNPG